MIYTITNSIKKNNISEYHKPLEDYLISNKEKGLFIVADGVSRDHINGEYPNPSPSADTAKISCHIINSLFCSDLNNKKGISEIIEKANNEINKYNEINNYETFLPGTVALICSIDNNTMNILNIGDCSAYLIREKKLKKITKSQTDLIRKHNREFSSSFIRNTICNNIKHPYSYGVLNGDSRAKEFINYDRIELKKDDIIILSSDGIDNLFENFFLKIVSFDANKIIELAEQVENDKSDDKAVISIKIVEL